MTQKSTQGKNVASKKNIGVSASADTGVRSTKPAATDVPPEKTTSATTFKSVADSLGPLS